MCINMMSVVGTSIARQISTSKIALTRIHTLVRINQNGLCWHCSQPITQKHDIVSRGQGRRYYYHLACAKKLNIIWIILQHSPQVPT